MQFMRFAPAVLLSVALVFWFLPWVPNRTGFVFWLALFDIGNGSQNPVGNSLQVLFAGYPLALLLGTIAALGTPLSSRWAVFVGISALVPLVTLTGIYLYLLILEPRGFHELTVWFYLSHATTLVCVILCIREYKRSST